MNLRIIQRVIWTTHLEFLLIFFAKWCGIFHIIISIPTCFSIELLKFIIFVRNLCLLKYIIICFRHKKNQITSCPRFPSISLLFSLFYGFLDDEYEHQFIKYHHPIPIFNLRVFNWNSYNKITIQTIKLILRGQISKSCSNQLIEFISECDLWFGLLEKIWFFLNNRVNMIFHHKKFLGILGLILFIIIILGCGTWCGNKMIWHKIWHISNVTSFGN